MEESYSLYEKDYCMPVFGMHNTGSICWFNSLLQAIFSLPAVNEKILSGDNSTIDSTVNPLNAENSSEPQKLQPNSDSVLFQCMKNVLLRCLPRSKKINNPAANIHQLENLSNEILMAFCVELRKHDKIIDIRSQEGVINGICLFFEMLDSTEINNVIFNKYRKTIDCELCQKPNVSEVHDFSPIINIFADNKLTTEELFVNYIKRRLVPVYGYKCEHCGKTMNKTLRFESIRRLSEVIIVAYAFPENIAGIKYFPPTMSFMNSSGQMMRYKAVVQIEHSGSYDFRTHTSGGHYYVRCTRNANINSADYYTLNDISVNPFRQEIKHLQATPQTHIVFYHMIAVEDPTKEERIKYENVLKKINFANIKQ